MSPPYDDGWYSPPGNPTFSTPTTPTAICAHGSPTYLVCALCAQEKDRKKHRVEALANALAKADGDMKQSFLEAHTKVYELMDENARLKSEFDVVVRREASRDIETQQWRQRAYNAESQFSFVTQKVHELQAELLKMKKDEQERIDKAIAELELKEKVIPAQSLRKVDLED